MTATPQMMLSRKCYQVSKPEIEFHIMNIMYAALHMRAYRKDDIFMQRRLAQRIKCIGKWGQGTKSPEFLQKVQPFYNSNFDKTFPAEAYSCLQVCVIRYGLLMLTKNIGKMCEKSYKIVQLCIGLSLLLKSLSTTTHHKLFGGLYALSRFNRGGSTKF